MQLVSLEAKLLIANDKLDDIRIRLDRIEKTIKQTADLIEAMYQTNKRARVDKDLGLDET